MKKMLINRTTQRDIFHHIQPQISLKIVSIFLFKSFLFMMYLLIPYIIITPSGFSNFNLPGFYNIIIPSGFIRHLKISINPALCFYKTIL
jgi:hypothetical protein